MGKINSDEKDEIFNANTESALRERVGQLEVEKMNIEEEIKHLKLTIEAKEEMIEDLQGVLEVQNNTIDKLNTLNLNQKSTIKTLLDIIDRRNSDDNCTESDLNDFLNRQKRIFQNKVNHGFNTTNIYQEARYILEEVAELMRAVEKNDRENMLEELADIVIFSYGCAEVARLGDLDTKIFEKMKLNEKRVYKKNGEGDFVKTAITKA